MYLKVDINGEEQIFAFENKASVTIGRAPNSDIQLLAEGISRNHLVVVERQGEYFVEDVGSTNGTFLNEKRLQPNELTPFNSFFPMKLGFHVYLYLVDEVASEQLMAKIEKKQILEEEKKREELKKQRKEKLESERIYVPKNKTAPPSWENTGKIKRKKIAVKKAPPKKKKDNFIFKSGAILSLIIGLSFALKEEFFQKVKAPAAPATSLGEEAKAVAPASAPEKKETGFTSKSATNIVFLDKCLGRFEEKLCKRFSAFRAKEYYEGFVKLASSFFLAINHQKLIGHYSVEYGYNDQEKEEVLRSLKSYLGRRFSRQRIEENDYRHEAIDFQDPLALKAALVTDLVQMDWGARILENEEIQDFYVILYKDNSSKEPLAFGKFGRNLIKDLLAEEDLKKNLKFFWRSGLKIPLIKFFESREQITLEGF